MRNPLSSIRLLLAFISLMAGTMTTAQAAPPPTSYAPQAQAILDPLSQALKDLSLQNYKSALPVLQQYANNSQVKAIFALANLYMMGQGVDQDQAKAADLYQKAAGLGFAPAQYAFGGLLEHGWGVKADENLAMQWYGRAAAQDLPAACFRLGKMLLQRAASDAKKQGIAFAWITHASELGYPQAHYDRGVMLWQGNGTPRDRVEAYRWIVSAAQAGVGEARKLADQLASVLSGAERSEALARLRTTPMPAPALAK